MTIRAYEIYGTPGGHLSSKTADYRGDLLMVAAVSIKQAYYFAGRPIWIADPWSQSPEGLIAHYTRNSLARGFGGVRLWCGCVGHGLPYPAHRDGIKAIRQSLRQHAEVCPRRPLGGDAA